MGTTRKYAVIDPATGKIDRRIFAEQAIYRAGEWQLAPAAAHTRWALVKRSLCLFRSVRSGRQSGVAVP